MAAEPFVEANRFVFEGKDISGSVDTTSIAGGPIAAITVDDIQTHEPTIERGWLGWTVNAAVDIRPDLYSRAVTVVLPNVNVAAGASEGFDGLVIVVRRRTSIGGSGLVKGPIESYEVRTVTGTGSIVQS